MHVGKHSRHLLLSVARPYTIRSLKAVLPALIGMFLAIWSTSPSLGEFWSKHASPTAPTTLSGLCSGADDVVVAELVRVKPYAYLPLPLTTGNSVSAGKSSPHSFSEAELTHALACGKAGDYTFQQVEAIKGSAPATFTAAMPEISAYYYEFDKVPVRVGDDYIVFMKLTGAGYIASTTETPLIPLGILTKPAPTGQGARMHRLVVWMTRALSNPDGRQISALFLSALVDPIICTALQPYISDPDLDTRDSAVCAELRNHNLADASALIQVGRIYWQKTRSAPRALSGLCSVQSARDACALCPLLLEHSVWMRMAAATAIKTYPGPETVPYSVLDLQDPDPQVIAPYYSYIALHSIIPKLGKPDGLVYFQDNRQDETTSILAWWREAVQSNDSKGGTQATGNSGSTPSVAWAMHWLYVGCRQERLRTVRYAASSSDNSYLPVLVLAAEDPDDAVAYAAYTSLVKRLKVAGVPATSSTFTMHRQSVLAPIYLAWTGVLSGN